MVRKSFRCVQRQAPMDQKLLQNPVSHGDILCAKCVTAYDHVSAARDTDVQMLLQMEAVSLSGKHTVPWSNLWQRVILASSTSGPGWSSTCLHHWRGLRTLSSCSLDLGLTYSLERTKQATILSWDLYSVVCCVTLQRVWNPRDLFTVYLSNLEGWVLQWQYSLRQAAQWS